MRSGSDNDILIVMPNETPDGLDDELAGNLAGNLAGQVTRWTGNEVRPLLYRVAEVKAAPVFDAMIREGVDVAGDPAWLRWTARRH